jgi:RNA polymerase sigma-70 factor (ECF subfamily)
LVQRIAAGDERALEALYAAHSQRIYNYALRLLGNEWDAEEVLQDVFVGAWKNARRFNFQSRVTTWLLRIAHNQAIDRLRVRKSTMPFDDLSRVLFDERSANAFERFDKVEVLQAAMARLSADHRAVIELTFVHGLSYEEIAAVMSSPIGSVKSRIHYALLHLQRFLMESGSA